MRTTMTTTGINRLELQREYVEECLRGWTLEDLQGEKADAWNTEYNQFTDQEFIDYLKIRHPDFLEEYCEKV